MTLDEFCGRWPHWNSCHQERYLWIRSGFQEEKGREIHQARKLNRFERKLRGRRRQKGDVAAMKLKNKPKKGNGKKGGKKNKKKA